jgi:predicted secreted hydrolase
MWRIVTLGAVVLAVVILGLSLIDVSTTDTIEASTVLIGAPDPVGFARATEPLDWQFPLNFGAHPDYQTEWWYYTGNLATADGRRFGYQFTIFRRSISPEAATTDSEWRTNQLYMAHFGITDVTGERFFHDERFSRGSADLAGATIDPRYRVWLENWEVIALDDEATLTQITAAMDGAALDLTLDQLKPPALQGEGGLSQKSAELGNASHYYSLTRLASTGTITIGDEVFEVTGYSWKDHEFSTSALGSNALGWDWFGLQFDDNRELMVGQIRMTDGGRDPYFGGLLVQPDGSTVYLPAESFTIEATGTWTSPHTDAVYPSGWRITVSPPDEAAFTFTATPQMLDQELHGGGIAYWEGSVRIEGDVTGWGYAELTGYVDAMTGRF